MRNIFLTIVYSRDWCITASEGDNVISIPVHPVPVPGTVTVHDPHALGVFACVTFHTHKIENSFVLATVSRCPMNSHFR